MHEHPESLDEHIDRLVTCDLRGRPYFLPLYQAARSAQGAPLCGLAARRLAASLQPARGEPVLFVTGFLSPILGVGEQDGPVGVAYLGRVLEQLFGVVPVVVTDAVQIPLVSQTLRGGGFNVIPVERAREAGRRGKGKAAAVLPFLAEPAAAAPVSERLFTDLAPRAVIAIERPGGNAAGIPHSFTAIEIADTTAPTDEVLRTARRQGIVSVGIGDAGNELGCGLIHEEIEAILGARGQCGVCHASIAAAEAADVLVMAAVSNWGAYGVAAALAALLGRPAALPGRDVLRLTLEACTLAGGRNGISDWTDPGSDGYPLDVDLAVLEMLRQLAASTG
jgi:hypothetical protein